MEIELWQLQGNYLVVFKLLKVAIVRRIDATCLRSDCFQESQRIQKNTKKKYERIWKNAKERERI